MRGVIGRVVDDGEFLEVHQLWAENIVVGFARLGGHPVGIVGNNPKALAGTLDIDSSVKAARFVRTRCVQPPARPFVDVPGFLPGRRRSGAGSSATARSSCTPTRSDRAEDRADHPQGLRRRLRRDELQAHPRRLQLRLADRRGRGHGARGRRQHRLPQGAGGGGRPRGTARRADRRLQGAVRQPVPAAERGYVDDVIEPRRTRACSATRSPPR